MLMVILKVRNIPSWHQGGSRGIALLVVNLGAKYGGCSTPRPGRFIPGKEPPYPLYSGLCGSQGRSKWVLRRENLLSTGIWRSGSLCRLRYPRPIISVGQRCR